ncbi:antibiotic biosynthesis monooxygenase family protein [Kitasatospora sp. NPDC056446]|uniref:antibiotic biosynthesis monooxygenase family protein n=1 Tax=Kitasatospora sp. NPDC056446 TaxID=3345819 RepID=UPI0036B3D4E4
MITLINQLTVTGSEEEFRSISAELNAFMSQWPGYRSHTLLRSVREAGSYAEVAQWDDAASHQAAVRTEEFQALIKRLAQVIAKPAPGLYETVTAHQA